MIAFLYRMRVKPGRKRDFDLAWQEGTLIARDRFGSGGSHLFALDDGTRLAKGQSYARLQDHGGIHGRGSG